MVLIDAKADVQAFDKYQWIPFHLDKTGVATVLIDAKADVQAFDKYHSHLLQLPIAIVTRGGVLTTCVPLGFKLTF